MLLKRAAVILGILIVWATLVHLNHAALAQTGCSRIYDPGNGWAVEMCTSDPAVTTPMQVFLDGGCTTMAPASTCPGRGDEWTTG